MEGGRGGLMGVGGQSNMWTRAQDLLIWLKPYFPMVQSSSGLILVPSGLQCVGFIHHLWGGLQSFSHIWRFKVDIADCFSIMTE